MLHNILFVRCHIGGRRFRIRGVRKRHLSVYKMATSTQRRLKLTAEDPEDKEKLLDEKARDSLQFSHAALCSHMNPDGVRRILFTCNVLTADEKEEAQRPDLIKSQKSEKLVDSVRQRGWRDIIKFAAILIATNQEDLAADLMQTLKQQLEEHSIDVREEVDQAKEKILKLHQKVSPAHNKPDYTYYLSELDKEHADLQEAVYCVLRKADSEQLSTRLISLLTSYKDRALACEDIDSAIKSLQKCFEKEPPKNVFMYVTPFMDKLDVRLLEGLIKFASKENSSSAKYAKEQKIDLDQQLDEYKSKVTSACEKTLELCPRQPANKQPKNGLLVAMQTYLPEHDVTITKICRLKKYLRDDLGMEETVFEGFSCSNVTLFFSVSKDRLPFLVHWCCLHRRDLMEKFSVELVFSPGHFVYNLYADQECPYPQADLSQPQPAVPEKEPVGLLSEIKENLTATLQGALWNWQIAFEKKSDEWRAELQGKIGEVQQAILSERECKEVKLPEEARDKGGLAKELGKPIEEYKWKLEDAELKLQKAQSDLENKQRNWELEKDTTKHLRTEIAQLNHSLSSREKEVQALKDQSSHRREVMQQVVKLLQAQVAAVRSDLDQERSRQSELKDSVEQLLNPQSGVVRFLKTELVSRAAELQKCRDELKTTTAERDRLHRLQEHMTRNLVQFVTKVIAGVHKVSAGVSELDKGVQQLQDQATSSSEQQSFTGPAPVSKNLTEDGTRRGEIFNISEPQTGAPNIPVSETFTEEGTFPEEMLSVSKPPSSLTGQSSTGEPHAQMETELVSRTTELQKCRDELKTTTAERDRLHQTIAMKQYMDQQFHRLQEQMTQNLVQIVTKVIAGVHEVSAGVSELNKELQQLQDQGRGRHARTTGQTLRTPLLQESVDPSLLQQALTLPKLMPYIPDLADKEYYIAVYLDMHKQRNSLTSSQPELRGRLQKLFAMWLEREEDSETPHTWDFFISLVQEKGIDQQQLARKICGNLNNLKPLLQTRRDTHARTTGQTSWAPLLQESVDPYLLQQTPTLRKLMPYIPYLADKGACIAGYLDMQKQWDSLASSHPEPGGRLQKLFEMWLAEGKEDSETPPTWDFFISLVQKKGIDQHQLAKIICSNLNTSAPNS